MQITQYLEDKLKTMKPVLCGVSWNSYDICARYSILLPLTGKFTKKDKEEKKKEILRKVTKAGSLYLSLARELATANYSGYNTTRDIYLIGTCCPDFIKHKSISKHINCGRNYICPYCYAKQVRLLCAKVIASKKEIFNQNMLVLCYRHTVTIQDDPKKSEIILRDSIDKNRAYQTSLYQKLLNKRNCTGAFQTLTIEPSLINYWKLSYSGIFILPNTYSDIDYANDFPKNSRQRYIPTYDIKKIAKLVAWTFRYPSLLLRSKQTNKIINILNARYKKRLSATYGMLRCIY